MPKTIAILLTVFNRKNKTLKCLQRIYNQKRPPNYKVDTYITNDACTDGTPEAISEQFPQVHIINGSGNLFWNRGMYTAWKEASQKDYDFYLWLNDDTFVYNNMLECLIRASSVQEDNAIIVGATQSLDHSKATYGGRLYNGKIPIPNGELTLVNYFNGNIVLVPRNVFLKLGNLDYYFTHSKGDFDYGFRANKAGIKIFQVGVYLGECEDHKELDKWCNPNIPFLERWRALNRPNGMPPKETLHLEKKHYNLGIALFHFMTIYIRCLFPSIWIKLKKL